MISFIVFSLCIYSHPCRRRRNFPARCRTRFFRTCRSRVGDSNPLPDGFCLFCCRRNFLLAELLGDYRQVGDVPLLKFFVVEEGGGQSSKKLSCALKQPSNLFARNASAKPLAYGRFFCEYEHIWANLHADINMLRFCSGNGKSQ